jgi:hypothetical protein
VFDDVGEQEIVVLPITRTLPARVRRLFARHVLGFPAKRDDRMVEPESERAESPDSARAEMVEFEVVPTRELDSAAAAGAVFCVLPLILFNFYRVME